MFFLVWCLHALWVVDQLFSTVRFTAPGTGNATAPQSLPWRAVQSGRGERPRNEDAAQQWKWKCQSLGRVWPFTTPWTITRQAPLSIARMLLLCPGKNTGVGCCFFLQGIFLTQGLNPHLLSFLHCTQILYPLSYRGSPPAQQGCCKRKEDITL